MSRKLLLVLALSGLLNLVAGIWYFQEPNTQLPPGEDGALTLTRPWFIDHVLANEERTNRAVANIADEAGLAAYAKISTPFLLSRVEPAFTSITEKDPAGNYILGVITPTGYSPYWGAQVLVHKTGWVLAWYHKDWLASTIVHVKDTTFSNKTKLSLPIDTITSTLKIATVTPSYYHFKYPNANRLLIARKSLVSGYKIRMSYPSTFTYYDTSAYYEYATEHIGHGSHLCSTQGWWGSGLNDWQKRNVGLFLNDTNVITQTNAIPSDDEQYKSISSFLTPDYMNELRFSLEAGDLTSDNYDHSERRCQSFAVVVVYRV